MSKRFEEVGSRIYVRDTTTGKLVLRSTKQSAGKGKATARPAALAVLRGY